MKEAANLEPLALIEDAETQDRFVLYAQPNGINLELRFEGDEPWATQKQMAELFGVTQQNVAYHIREIDASGELEGADPVYKEILYTAADGKRYNTKIYSLDMILSVGHRINSKQGVMFRRWSRQIERQYLLKGFVIDSPRLKGKPDRVTELRIIIRDIRGDEANVYAELRRICSMCSDYNPSSGQARDFYARMQAKLYWATVARTGAELLRERVNASADNCGLQTWEGDRVLQDDVLNAKNTLASRELEELNRVTDILLSVFEDQLDVGRLTTMADADRLLDEQLAQLGRAVLAHGGSVSSDQAKTYARAQYKLFDTYRKTLEKTLRHAEIAELRNAGKTLPKVRKKKGV